MARTKWGWLSAVRRWGVVLALTLFGCGGGPAPSALRIDPATVTLDIGGDATLTARFVVEGSSEPIDGPVTWASSDPGVVTATPGAGSTASVHGVAAGTATVSATAGGLTGQAVITVQVSPLTTITVAPTDPALFVGATVQLTATGTYGDGSMADLTGQVTWDTGASTVATVSAAGLVTAVGAGDAEISASSGTVSGSVTVTVSAIELASITVTPPDPTVPVGRTQQFGATGHYTDGSMADLTGTATWASSNTTAATISATGLASAEAQGTSIISATVGLISGTTNLTVGPPVIDSIAVTPVDPHVAFGGTLQFTATATLSDGSMQDVTATASWMSSVTTIATIAPGGLASAVSAGTTTISAQQSLASGSTTLTVDPAVLESITIEPGGTDLALGLTRNLVATGHYTDGSMMDLTATATWSSSMPSVISVSDLAGSKGLAEALAGGSATITASVGALDGTLGLGVCQLVVDEVMVAGTSNADEFVEIATNCGSPQSLAGLRIVYRSSSGTSDVSLVALSGTIVAGAHPFYVNANFLADPRYVAASGSFSTGPSGGLAGSAGGLALRNGPVDTGVIVDSMGYGNATNAFVETAPCPAPGNNVSASRFPDAVDTGDNSADFAVRLPTPGFAN